MIVNFVHEFYAKCNRTVVIFRVCLFFSPHRNDKMLPNRCNDPLDGWSLGSNWACPVFSDSEEGII